MSKAPYTFVPVILNDNAVVDTPFHDQQAENGLTGEIRITLKTLTPFLPGHYQYKITQLQNDTGIDRNLYDEEKNILEPLFLEGKTDSSVLISGSSIKGMLRHSIGAMFGSPMERVQEQKYSYRPNLGVINDKFKAKEAIIQSFNEDGSINIKIITTQARNNRGNAVFRENRKQNHINYTEHDYTGGVDNGTRLNKTTNGTTQTYKRAWLPENLDDQNAVIPENIVNQYNRTQDELADMDVGHLSRRSDIKSKSEKKSSRKAILQTKNLKVGQLIYVDIDQDNNVVSFGHNFRYRWRYADSVRTVNGNEREIVKKQDAEEVDQQTACLTATRSLFGYVDDDTDNNETKTNNLKLGIGQKDYSRFAGRIAINTAVEVLGDGDALLDRFVQHSDHYHIPLKPLGEPNASAVEFYLNQDEIQTHGYVNTYGDLPGVESSGVELNGRKFYRHQPKAREKAIYQAQGENIKSKHGTLARFICKPDRTFKYTLRFKNLRDWELGAVLLALNPDLIRQTNFLQNHQEELDNVVYAQKLGYGRPLGLGSVINQIDKICLLNSENITMGGATNQAKDYVQIFVNDAKNLPVEDWLKVMNYSASKDRIYAYPTKNVRGETTIYNYHTDIRKTHSENRRKTIPKNGRSHGNQVKP